MLNQIPTDLLPTDKLSASLTGKTQYSDGTGNFTVVLDGAKTMLSKTIQ